MDRFRLLDAMTQTASVIAKGAEIVCPFTILLFVNPFGCRCEIDKKYSA
jgi:hypothetical protein